jgi:hypothetical protein
MNKEKTIVNLASLGIVPEQVEALVDHLEIAEGFVYRDDPGIEQAFHWLHQSLFSALPEAEARLLYKIAEAAKIDPKVEYLEKGYDSCQAHRKLSKVVGEAIMYGGLLYEAGLLKLPKEKVLAGVPPHVLNLTAEELMRLEHVAKVYGGVQDFLFPGVTPSSGETKTLSEMAYSTLCGRPETSVRTLTGVGGLRFDKDWNFATDLVTFANLKITEDKRYYPGIGVFHFLSENEIGKIPILGKLKIDQPKLFLAIAEFTSVLKRVQKSEYGGVSVLCSAYLPPWSELKKMQGLVTQKNMDLSQAFHSPSYEFVILRDIFEKVAKGEIVDGTYLAGLSDLSKKMDHCWSFNSTIHLPWTAELASLSNDFIGRITNLQGDYCVRYGIGYKGKSFEIREYCFGNQRKFPQDLAGKKAYGLRWYPSSEIFKGSYYDMSFDRSEKFIQKVINKGFLAAALELLESRREM